MTTNLCLGQIVLAHSWHTIDVPKMANAARSYRLGPCGVRSEISGEGGIRTPGPLSETQHFQCCTIGRSATSPCVGFYLLDLAFASQDSQGFDTSGDTY